MASETFVTFFHRQPYEEVKENGKILFRENRPERHRASSRGFRACDEGAWVGWK